MKYFINKMFLKLLHIQNTAGKAPYFDLPTMNPLEHLLHTTLVRIMCDQLYEALTSDVH